MEEPNTMREVLDIVDEFLTAGPREEATNLWDVLTALRGPDDRDSERKLNTTGRIRVAAFPAAFQIPLPASGVFSRQGAIGNPDGKPVIAEPGTSHFLNHVRNAAQALGILAK